MCPSPHQATAQAHPALALLLAKAEATIANVCVHTHTPGKEQSQLSSAAPTSLDPTQSLTKAHTPEKKQNELRSAAPSRQAPDTPPTKAETANTLGRSPIPSELLLQLLRP